MISDLAEGATKGLLNYGEEKIKQFAESFRSKKLKFIGDEKIISSAKATQKSGEWVFYKNYIKDKELLFIIKLGLVLRKIEDDSERIENLKEKIKKKYDISGLHVAYFVQNGILNRYVGILLDDLDSTESFDKIISNVLSNIDKHAIFISSRYTQREILKDSMTITSAHQSSIFIVSGMKSAAKIVRDSEKELVEVLGKYELEKISTGSKEILFFKLVE